MKIRSLFLPATLAFLFSCDQKGNNNPGPANDSTAMPAKTANMVNAASVDSSATGATDSTYAYIKNITQKADSIFIEADYIQFLTGKAALAAAEKNHEADTMRDDNGKITGIIVDDDYYILNENKKLRTLPLSKDVMIETVDMSSGPVSSKKTTLKEFIQNHGKNSFPFILKFKNNIVTEITEVYVP